MLIPVDEIRAIEMSNLSISITEYKNGLEDSNKLPTGYWMGVQVGRTDGYMV